MEYLRLYIVMVVICSLEKDIDKVLQFHLNNFSFFEISVSLFWTY